MNKQTLSRIAHWCAIALAGAAAALQTAAMLTSYAPDKNYFIADAPLPTVAAILAILAGVCGLLSAITAAKEALASPIIDSVLLGIPASCGFAYGAFLLVTASTSPLAIPTAITMLGAALYALLLTERNAKRFPRALTLLGFFAVAASAMINVYCYFDASLEMNAPVKVSIQTAFLFAMVQFATELRFLLGREKPRLYLVLSYCTIAALSLPAISIYAAHTNEIISRTDYFAFGVASLGLMASVLLRTLCYVGILKQETPEPEEATESEEAQAPQEETEEAIQENDEEKETEEE